MKTLPDSSSKIFDIIKGSEIMTFRAIAFIFKMALLTPKNVVQKVGRERFKLLSAFSCLQISYYLNNANRRNFTFQNSR